MIDYHQMPENAIAAGVLQGQGQQAHQIGEQMRQMDERIRDAIAQRRTSDSFADAYWHTQALDSVGSELASYSMAEYGGGWGAVLEADDVDKAVGVLTGEWSGDLVAMWIEGTSHGFVSVQECTSIESRDEAIREVQASEPEDCEACNGQGIIYLYPVERISDGIQTCEACEGTGTSA